MKLKFNEAKCTGCYACYVVCIAEHHLPEEEDAVSFRKIQKREDEAAGFQKNVCQGCLQCGKCIETCPVQAIYREKEFGIVLVDREKCIGCRACEASCPVHVIQYDKDGKMVKCDGCISRLREGREPACVRVCCMKAIEMME